MTDYEKHQLKIIYEEATSRRHNSIGAWHTKLVEYLRELDYPTSGYPQAKSLAEQLLTSLEDKGE